MPLLGRTGARSVAGWKRSALCAALLACALVVTGVRAGDARAALNWNATPLPVQAGHSLTDVVCPSASLCVASSNTQELAFNPSRFKRPQPHTLLAGRGLVFDGLWCPTSSSCIAVDFQSPVRFNPVKFGLARGKSIEPVSGEGLVSLRCPTRTECVAVDSFGDGMSFDPQNWKPIKRQIKVDSNEAQTALACPSAKQCTSLDNDGYEYTFNPQTGRRLGSAQIDSAVGLDAPSGASDNELDGISCPTTKLCAAVDTLGNIVTFDPQGSGAAATTFETVSVPADQGNSLSAISCKPNGVCVAVDRAGNAIGGSAISNSWQLQVVDAGHALNSVACPTLTECVAVDNRGSAFRLYPTLS
jgi:hypothetical protein